MDSHMDTDIDAQWNLGTDLDSKMNSDTDLSKELDMNWNLSLLGSKTESSRHTMTQYRSMPRLNARLPHITIATACLLTPDMMWDNMNRKL